MHVHIMLQYYFYWNARRNDDITISFLPKLVCCINFFFFNVRNNIFYSKYNSYTKLWSSNVLFSYFFSFLVFSSAILYWIKFLRCQDDGKTFVDNDKDEDDYENDDDDLYDDNDDDNKEEDDSGHQYYSFSFITSYVLEHLKGAFLRISSYMIVSLVPV